MSRLCLTFAVQHALDGLAPVVVRHGPAMAYPAIAAALGMLLVEQHRRTHRENPEALQSALRIIQAALEDGVVGAVEGSAMGPV